MAHGKYGVNVGQVRIDRAIWNMKWWADCPVPNFIEGGVCFMLGKKGIFYFKEYTHYIVYRFLDFVQAFSEYSCEYAFS